MSINSNITAFTPLFSSGNTSNPNVRVDTFSVL
uniref:Uncharacterized protein n=1 Tax=Podoviridae sp. ct8Lf7 TaxID=2827723 RepID=A0A8S5S0U4_9CAUD|nr:MAG TPA: hypothetical protein [Podoviridae sp. ct8Lf7]